MVLSEHSVSGSSTVCFSCWKEPGATKKYDGPEPGFGGVKYHALNFESNLIYNQVIKAFFK